MTSSVRAAYRASSRHCDEARIAQETEHRRQESEHRRPHCMLRLTVNICTVFLSL